MTYPAPLLHAWAWSYRSRTDFVRDLRPILVQFFGFLRRAPAAAAVEVSDAFGRLWILTENEFNDIVLTSDIFNLGSLQGTGQCRNPSGGAVAVNGDGTDLIRFQIGNGTSLQELDISHGFYDDLKMAFNMRGKLGIGCSPKRPISCVQVIEEWP